MSAPSSSSNSAPKHKNTYDAASYYAGFAVPTVDFGSTKGKHVKGNCNSVEAKVSVSSFVSAKRRHAAKAVANHSAAAAGKKTT